ncbi:MAG TPA: hypothetical protein DCW83_01495 [Saprospirales bacterium]|jgi:hypothetical protein|nr:hypothetical protein [Saprospirales bacterium]
MATLNPNVDVSVSNDISSSGLNGLNYLQPSAFSMVIDRKHYANLQFFCQAILHPSLNMNSVEQPFRKISSVPFVGDKLTFSELTAIILVDENLNSYTEMYNWMHRLVENNTTNPTDKIEGKPPAYADITVNILSSHNNSTRQIRYIDCMPVSLGDMSLEATSGAQQYITYPASFRFSYFELR